MATDPPAPPDRWAPGTARPATFFYGTFMHPVVLAKHRIDAGAVEPARVRGLALTIRPRVNLVASELGMAFGGLVAVAHADLARLYNELRERYGIVYHPTAVLAETTDGRFQPALCYVAAEIPAAPPDPAYVAEMAWCVRALGLPEWYARHVESFAPTRSGAGARGSDPA